MNIPNKRTTHPIMVLVSMSLFIIRTSNNLILVYTIQSYLSPLGNNYRNAMVRLLLPRRQVIEETYGSRIPS